MKNLTKKRILITGGSGLFALNAAAHLRKYHHIILGVNERVINFPGVVIHKLPLDNFENLKKILSKIQPDLVINAAGLSSVELCEKDKKLAAYVNAYIAENVAKACDNLSYKMVHISTDHLFSGNKKLVDEDELINPLNNYAKTKGIAEQLITNINKNALIIRTNFFGWGTTYRKSFTEAIINNLRKNESIKLFDDVFYTPIVVSRLIDIILMLSFEKLSGIFNVVSDERISKYEFGLNIADIFNLNKEFIIRSQLSKVSNLTQRPFDMSLSNKKVSTSLRINIGNTIEQLNDFHKQEKDNSYIDISKI